MKKIYLKPETIWMNVEIHQMICESGPDVIGGGGNGGTTDDPNDLLSRESYDAWDD